MKPSMNQVDLRADDKNRKSFKVDSANTRPQEHGGKIFVILYIFFNPFHAVLFYRKVTRYKQARKLLSGIQNYFFPLYGKCSQTFSVQGIDYTEDIFPRTPS